MHTQKYVVFTRVYGLIFTKLSENIERLAGFIIGLLYLNCDDSLKRDVAMVTDLWRMSGKIDTPRLYSVHWHSISVGVITKRMENFHFR